MTNRNIASLLLITSVVYYAVYSVWGVDDKTKSPEATNLVEEDRQNLETCDVTTFEPAEEPEKQVDESVKTQEPALVRLDPTVVVRDMFSEVKTRRSSFNPDDMPERWDDPGWLQMPADMTGTGFVEPLYHRSRSGAK